MARREGAEGQKKPIQYFMAEKQQCIIGALIIARERDNSETPKWEEREPDREGPNRGGAREKFRDIQEGEERA